MSVRLLSSGSSVMGESLPYIFALCFPAVPPLVSTRAPSSASRDGDYCCSLVVAIVSEASLDCNFLGKIRAQMARRDVTSVKLNFLKSV